MAASSSSHLVPALGLMVMEVFSDAVHRSARVCWPYFDNPNIMHQQEQPQVQAVKCPMNYIANSWWEVFILNVSEVVNGKNQFWESVIEQIVAGLSVCKQYRSPLCCHLRLLPPLHNIWCLDWLSGKHTIFARVTKGMDVLKRMNILEVDKNDRSVLI